MKTYANISNGLAFPHDNVCMFKSTHGHNYKMGYFRIDAMPYSAVIELLKGNQIKIIDATHHSKPLTDGLKYGLTTWTLVFNRALGYDIKVAPWQTKEMRKVSRRNGDVKKLVRTIRGLNKLFGNKGPAIIGDNIYIECHQNFKYDDKMEIFYKKDNENVLA